MNRRIKSFLFCCLIGLLLIVILPKDYSWGAMIAYSTEELTNKSQSIIIGTVLNINSYWNEDKTLIFTNTLIQVKEFIKGGFHENPITVKHIGGTIGDLALKVSDTPNFQLNDEVMLFLNDDPESANIKILMARTQGKYSILENELTQVKEVVFEQGVRVDKTGAVFIEKGQRIALDEFIKQIQTFIANEE